MIDLYFSSPLGSKRKIKGRLASSDESGANRKRKLLQSPEPNGKKKKKGSKKEGDGDGYVVFFLLCNFVFCNETTSSI